MKKCVRMISVLIVMMMLLSSIPLFAYANGVDADADVITVGNGGDYSTIAAAISDLTANGLDGKTLKLVSDVKVASTKFESTSATAPVITVDGDGHSVTMSTGFVCIGVNITFKNINATQGAPNHPFIYARGNSYVTVENCTTNDSFNYVFALNTAGNCNITVTSGNYSAKQKIFSIDAYNNGNAAANTVKITGGFFNAGDGTIAAVSANTKLIIEGGIFYTETKAPMIVDTKNFVAGSTNKASVTVSGASFIYPIDGMGMFGENTEVKVAANMTADATTKLFAIIEGSTDGKAYMGQGATTSGVYSFPELTTLGAVTTEATLINGNEGVFAKAYIKSGKNFLINSADTLKFIDDPLFDGAIVVFSADCTATVDYSKANITIDKNGYLVPNVTSTTGIARIRSDLSGARMYWQATGENEPQGEETCKVRFVVGINGEIYKAAGLLYTTDPTRANAANLVYETDSEYGESVKIYKTDGYYTSILAKGETVEAIELGGRALLVLDAGEYTAEDITKPIYARAYLVDANGNITYTDIKQVNIDTNFAGAGELVDTYRLDQGHSMALYAKTSRAGFDAKCADLVTDGYTLKQETVLDASAYRTYYKESDNSMCHIYWANYNKQMRITTATTDKLPINSISGNNDLCTAKLITLQGGDELGMVIRLNDGRFIVIDGGNDNAGNGEEIYNILKANAPDPDNVVIATWYITHAHGDHQGGFLDFARRYYQDSTVTLESIMFNQLNNGEYIDKGTTSNSVLSYRDSYYPTVPVYMPLTGQKYTFSKTTIEILYTMADFLPNKLTLMPDGSSANANTQTMPCIIDIVNDADYDDRLFVMGDMVVYACDDICDRYGNLIACDIVQVSHHGLCIAPYATPGYRRDNSTEEIYTLMNPTVAFWPGKEDQFENRMTGPVNIHLAEIIGGKDKFLKAWEQQHVLEFKQAT